MKTEDIKQVRIIDTFGTTTMEVQNSIFNDGILTLEIDRHHHKMFEPHNHTGQPLTNQEYIDTLKLKTKKDE